jgi:hypothetical protein
MLSRAQKLCYDTYIYTTEKGYEIKIDLNFPDYGRITEIVSVNDENEDSQYGTYDFNTMMGVLEDELKVLKQKEGGIGQNETPI